MNYNGPNWYSTNSLRKYQNNKKYAQYRQPEQYSDEGRVPLGSTDDAEAVQMREKILESVSEETLKLWQEFRKDWSDKCLLGKPQIGNNEETEAKYRNYPDKPRHDFESTQNGDPREGLFSQWEDRSKYVINRKVNRVNPMPSASSEPAELSTRETTTPSTDDQDDRIFIDDRVPSASKIVRLVMNGDEEASSSSLSNFSHPRITAPDKPLKTAQQSVRKQQDHSLIVKTTSTVEKTPSLTVTVPSNIPECLLGKYCLDPLTCPNLHDGVLTKIPGKAFTRLTWPTKLPGVPICPGYVDLSCWDFKCEKRHVAYPSDDL